VLALLSFVQLVGLEANQRYLYSHAWEMVRIGSLDINFSFAMDPLSALMTLIITGVGSLIHIYAAGYMAHEEGYYRFFAYLNLFMFFMLILVLAANFLVLFVGWEGVGLCSYLLIGFYFTEKFAGDAGKKAFVVNRIGDFGFLLGMLLIVVTFGTLDFSRVFTAASAMPVETGAGVLTAICLLLLLGATGKSAQVPLYVWLPDAMAGPTPVSALIHAATMVTAGVYMVARSASLFTHAPIAMDVVAVIGLLTAVLAATIGITQNDIKKVFAYSTVSQLGYMFLALGVGAFSASIFHVMTHAFFKALLFLGAGSVIHALSGEQDLRNMGGLWKKIPITFWTMLAAGVAIAGVPPFSGFHSKDEILLAAHHHAPWMYWVGVVTAGITAFYVFRAIFLAFFGEPKGHHHPHESPFIMTGPLIVLALLSLFGGYIHVPEILEPIFGSTEGEHDQVLVMISVLAGVIGIGLAWVMYVAKPALADTLADRMGGLYRLVYNKYFLDEVYDATVVHPIENGSRVVLWRGMDVGLIDGMVNGIGSGSRGVGEVFRRLQSGNIRTYAAWVVLGSVIVIIAIGLSGTGTVRGITR
jgi:NADH-quinone oxidoreductase subunit L